MRESINSAVFLSFKLSSTVSLTHSYSQLTHPLTYILIKLQTLWRAKKRYLLLISVMAELQSSVTCSPAKWSCSHNSESTDAIPPLTTVWTAVAEWRCPCLFSLTPRAEEANQCYLWNIFIHEQWGKTFLEKWDVLSLAVPNEAMSLYVDTEQLYLLQKVAGVYPHYFCLLCFFLVKPSYLEITAHSSFSTNTRNSIESPSSVFPIFPNSRYDIFICVLSRLYYLFVKYHSSLDFFTLARLN